MLYQIGALDALSGGAVAYVKPHGALYNTIVRHEGHARAVVAAVTAYHRPLAVLGLPGSLFLDYAEAAGLVTVREAFADRAYTAAGTLVPRSQPGAVLHDPAAVAARVVRLATTGRLTAITGEELTVTAESVCVHGDTPGAVAIAAAVGAALAAAGVAVGAFAG